VYDHGLGRHPPDALLGEPLVDQRPATVGGVPLAPGRTVKPVPPLRLVGRMPFARPESGTSRGTPVAFSSAAQNPYPGDSTSSSRRRPRGTPDTPPTSPPCGASARRGGRPAPAGPADPRNGFRGLSGPE
jgi:hypothetical protein